MRKRNLWEKKETGRNIAIERGRQEDQEGKVIFNYIRRLRPV